MLDFIIVGGDMRMKYLEELFVNDGYSVKSLFLNSSANADDIAKCAVLPMPCVKPDGSLNAPFFSEKVMLENVVENLGGCRYLFGGMLPEDLKEQCYLMDIQCYDYMTYEPLTIRNAQATAEGAVKVAIENTDFTLCGSTVLVTGYGRIGKILAKYLKALGAHVTVEARKQSDLALIESYGYTPLPLENLYNATNQFDVIFNTVPYKIFTEREIINMSKNVVYIELASMPGGIDEVEAYRKKIKLIKAASLPGKTAPKTAAFVIKDAIINKLKEMEV